MGNAEPAERWFREAFAMADSMGAAPWRDRAAAALLAVH
jgi:hypothetical protein